MIYKLSLYTVFCVCTSRMCMCVLYMRYMLILVYYDLHTLIYILTSYFYVHIHTLIQEIRRSGISQQTRSIRQLLGDDFWVEEKVGPTRITLYIYTIFIHMLY